MNDIFTDSTMGIKTNMIQPKQLVMIFSSNQTWRQLDYDIPFGKLTVCYGKSSFLIGKSTN